MYSQDGTLYYRDTPDGGINYIYLGNRLVAKDGVILEEAGEQHYHAFGSSIEGEIDDAGYTGHKFDTDLGLTYAQARYYDPMIGRFYSNDPVDAFEFISQGNIQGFGRYTYANNNPYRYIDPDGESSLALCAAGPAGCVIGGGIQLGIVIGGLITGALIDSAVNPTPIMNESSESAPPDTESGKELDPADKGGELTKAGRAGQKHGSRPDSAFPTATGNAESKNNQGQSILEDIVNNPDSTSSGNQRGGTDVTAPDGRGARFNQEGKFTGFLEPKIEK